MNVQMVSLTCATLTLEFLFREVPHFFLFAKMIQSQTGRLALEVSEEDVQIIMEEVNICN